MMVAKIGEARPRLLIGTRKGAFALESNDQGKSWKLSGPQFLGHIIYHMVSDYRDPRVVLMAAKTGHLGPTVYVSKDGGQNFKEAKTPPAFARLAEPEHRQEQNQQQEQDHKKEGARGRTVEAVFWLSAGHKREKSVWYAGTTPPGLFKSQDDGDTWQEVAGLHKDPDFLKWLGPGGTPGGQMVHSVLIDPRDSAHMYLSISSGGTFESEDQGQSWRPINGGVAADFLPDEEAAYGHDPHCVVQHLTHPDRLYQQNHCGIYRLDRPSRNWLRIGDNMPEEVGDIGFPIVAHPRDQNRVWVFPMDGTSVWPRTSPDGKPAVYGSEDGGDSWKRLDHGLPQEHGYFTVKRQCMSADRCEKVGLYFGTTGGEVWASLDEGANWNCIVRHLPEIYSVTTVEKD